ncbi:hypothetical protein HYH03_017023 [Edaphochlamys debaryana]|uniref:von Hippel-Lindau disease tumour suppressor beta domain-containing protein n=1 Tax=Edaphochlamys debaryana TaxID=47281 RepID=A0A835XHZ6_9CHLO|nr:hypothetical protein HYH03_017023 [Edaphochlamys debaryana]|eukprot:KAG2484141.1 hypothetical protein HYH03_017023 [Edaphochlamys debaryana]
MAEQEALPVVSPPNASWTEHHTSPCTINVINNTGRPVQLVWLSYDGSEQVYNVLESGSEAHQNTYTTHVWHIKDEDGRSLIQYAGPSAKIFVTAAGISIVGLPPAPPAPAGAEAGPSDA